MSGQSFRAGIDLSFVYPTWHGPAHAVYVVLEHVTCCETANGAYPPTCPLATAHACALTRRYLPLPYVARVRSSNAPCCCRLPVLQAPAGQAPASAAGPSGGAKPKRDSHRPSRYAPAPCRTFYILFSSAYHTPVVPMPCFHPGVPLKASHPSFTCVPARSTATCTASLLPTAHLFDCSWLQVPQGRPTPRIFQ